MADSWGAWGILGPPGAPGGPRATSWGCLEAVLVPSWGRLGPFLHFFGRFLPLFGFFGEVLGPGSMKNESGMMKTSILTYWHLRIPKFSQSFMKIHWGHFGPF